MKVGAIIKPSLLISRVLTQLYEDDILAAYIILCILFKNNKISRASFVKLLPKIVDKSFFKEKKIYHLKINDKWYDNMSLFEVYEEFLSEDIYIEDSFSKWKYNKEYDKYLTFTEFKSYIGQCDFKKNYKKHLCCKFLKLVKEILPNPDNHLSTIEQCGDWIESMGLCRLDTSRFKNSYCGCPHCNGFHISTYDIAQQTDVWRDRLELIIDELRDSRNF